MLHQPSIIKKQPFYITLMVVWNSAEVISHNKEGFPATGEERKWPLARTFLCAENGRRESALYTATLNSCHATTCSFFISPSSSVFLPHTFLLCFIIIIIFVTQVQGWPCASSNILTILNFVPFVYDSAINNLRKMMVVNLELKISLSL